MKILSVKIEWLLQRARINYLHIIYIDIRGVPGGLLVAEGFCRAPLFVCCLQDRKDFVGGVDLPLFHALHTLKRC